VVPPIPFNGARRSIAARSAGEALADGARYGDRIPCLDSPSPSPQWPVTRHRACGVRPRRCATRCRSWHSGILQNRDRPALGRRPGGMANTPRQVIGNVPDAALVGRTRSLLWTPPRQSRIAVWRAIFTAYLDQGPRRWASQ